MTETTEETIDLKLEISSWDEKSYREFEDGRKFSRAEVQLKGVDGGPAGTFESLLYYRADGSSTYVTLMQLTGTLAGRTGSFTLQGEGHYDDGTASGESGVVAGSGTGELAGISGTAVSVSTHADYPFMPLTLTYRFG